MSSSLRSWCIKILLPYASWWVGRQEHRILKEGIELTSEEKMWAASVGVQDVDKVRLLYLPMIPLPVSSITYFVARMLGKPLDVGGMAAQYGIYVVKQSRNDPSILVHEMAHIAQYERMGGIRPFLEQYFEELFTEGYDNSGMELEARAAAIPYNRPPDR